MTCSKCLSGRHLRCHDRAACGCTICKSPTTRARALGRLTPAQRRTPRPPTKKVLVGYRTTLDVTDLPTIEYYLGCDLSLSEIARRMDTTRDKIRTVREHAHTH